MADNINLAYLRDAINLTNRMLKINNTTNHVLAVTNMILSGVITKEEAMRDEIYAEYVNDLKNKKLSR